MNRDILFRGKSILTGLFIEGNLVIDRNRKTFIIWFNHKQKECWTSIYPYSVGQYTGRTDKNGNKIFEGDIVIIDNSLKAVVIWFNGSFRFQDELSSKATSLDEMGVVMRNYDVQVIGNIHDNPELMK